MIGHVQEIINHGTFLMSLVHTLSGFRPFLIEIYYKSAFNVCHICHIIWRLCKEIYDDILLRKSTVFLFYTLFCAWNDTSKIKGIQESKRYDWAQYWILMNAVSFETRCIHLKDDKYKYWWVNYLNNNNNNNT